MQSRKQCIILKGFLTRNHTLEKNHFVFASRKDKKCSLGKWSVKSAIKNQKFSAW
jgi:hypothetical protein